MIIIKKYNKSYEKIWDNFIEQANNGTIFQMRKFINYHLERRFDDVSLLIYYNQTLLSVIPGASIIEKDKKIFYSHPGISYGGFIIKNKLSFKLINDLIHAVDKYLIKNKFNKIFLINTPSLYWENMDQSLDYLLQWNKYKLQELYISHATNINSSEKIDNLLSKRKRRYMLNDKQLNEFSFQPIQKNEEFIAFYILLEKAKQKFNTTPTHSLKELIKLCDLFPKNVVLYVSKLQNKIIGGCLLFHTTKQTSLIFYNVIDNKMIESQLSALQLYQCMKICKKRGSKIFDFGVSQTPELANPLDPKFSLIQFKEQFGSHGFLRIAYQKEYK